MRANFWSVNYNERAFITMKEKKEVLDSSISFPARYYWKNIVIFNEKLTNCLFSLQYDVANLIFSFKYRQQEVDQNVNEKLLIFVTIRQKISSLNFSYLTRKFQIYAFAERCCFLTFSFKGKFKNIIFPWNGNIRKLMKIWPFLFFFSYSDININSTPSDRTKSPFALAMINNTCWMMVLALYHATILVCCKYLGNLSVIFSEDFAIYLNFKKLKTEMNKAS